MARAVTDPRELLQRLELPRSLLPAARAAARSFGLRVPHSYLALMRKGDANDPLLRQVLPIGEELQETPGFSDDPVGDLQAAQGTGILSKYAGRSLLLASAACAVHCRYCFRRAFPYRPHLAGRKGWQHSLESLRHHPDVTEIILSGGDPLTLDDGRLSALIADLDRISHLRRLRIHTRLPVVIPRRITTGLIDSLAGSRLQPVMVLHFNHPRELTEDVTERLKELRITCTLLNQSVLLRGINDDVTTLTQLSERLFDASVLPYYLHLLDRVRGAAHFEVGETEACSLMSALRTELPGYLVPRLVQEWPGEPAKTLIA
jgi:EF-P beta-lysylation protein EpmB